MTLMTFLITKEHPPLETNEGQESFLFLLSSKLSATGKGSESQELCSVSRCEYFL